MSHDRPIPDAAVAPYPPQPAPVVKSAVPVAADAVAADADDRAPGAAAAMWIAAGVGSAAVFAAALYATRQARRK